MDTKAKLLKKRQPTTNLANQLSALFAKTFKREPYTSSPFQHNLLAINNNNQLVYCDNKSTNKLFFIDLKKVVVQPIRCVPLIDLDVLEIKFNSRGNSLLVRGLYCVWIVTLPEIKNISSQEMMNSRASQVGQSTKFMYPEVRVLQADFHPLSDSHVVVLTSDSQLRVYNVGDNPKEPEQSIHLLKTSKVQQDFSSMSLSRTRLSLENSLEQSRIYAKKLNEYVCAFAFGGESNWDRFTIYYVTNKGLFYSVCPIIPYNCVIPEDYFPPSSDNKTKNFYVTLLEKSVSINDDKENKVHYVKTKAPNISLFKTENLLPCGPYNIANRDPDDDIFAESDCTSMCMLHTVPPSASAVVCMNGKGQASCFLLLEPSKPSWSPGEFTEQLLLYDVIDLNLPQNAMFEPGKKSGVIRPYLIAHPLDKQTIYCVHSAGVHELKFPFMLDIEHFINPVEQDESAPFPEPSLETSTAVCIVTTMLTDTSKPANPLGINFTVDPLIGSHILVVDPTGECICLRFERISIDEFKELRPLKLTHTKIEPFAEILKKEKGVERVPRLSSIETLHDKSSEAVLKMLVNTCNMFKEEHVQHVDLMESYTTQRIKQLQLLIESQQKKLHEIIQETKAQQERHIQHQKRIAEALKKQEYLNQKATKLLSIVRQKQPLTLAEQEFFQATRNIAEAVKTWESRIQEFKKFIQKSKIPVDEKKGEFSPKYYVKIEILLQNTYEKMKQARDILTRLSEKLNIEL